MSRQVLSEDTLQKYLSILPNSNFVLIMHRYFYELLYITSHVSVSLITSLLTLLLKLPIIRDISCSYPSSIDLSLMRVLDTWRSLLLGPGIRCWQLALGATCPTTPSPMSAPIIFSTSSNTTAPSLTTSTHMKTMSEYGSFGRCCSIQ